MSELPKVFANPINKELNNNEEFARGLNSTSNVDLKQVNRKINEIFSSNNHIYKSTVKITLKDDEIVTDIVGKTNINLLTMDNKLIKISDIIDIEKI